MTMSTPTQRERLLLFGGGKLVLALRRRVLFEYVLNGMLAVRCGHILELGLVLVRCV